MQSVDNFELIRRFMRFESTDQFYFMQILQRKRTVLDQTALYVAQIIKLVQSRVTVLHLSRC